MQLTRFDRWLRNKLAYETHIQTMRLPDRIPHGIRVIDLPYVPGQKYKHLMIARHTKNANALLDILRENQQMYATQIIDRSGILVRIFAPKSKSFTWQVISIVIISTCIYFALLYVKSLAENPKFRQNFMEALDIMKG